MKKKTRTLVIIVSVFALCMLVLTPYLFHKRPTTGSNELTASQPEPGKVQVQEPVRTHPPAPVSNSISPQKPAVVNPLSKPVSPHDSPVAKVSKPEMGKTAPRDSNLVLKKKALTETPNDKPLISQNDKPYIERKPEMPKQSQKMEPVSGTTEVEPERTSRWGVVLLADNSGIDGGISYRVAQIPVFNGIDLDVIAGIKEAGLGLSKYVYRNVGLGVTGTVMYSGGEKKLGVYGKYSL
jgi:hypothetical protein